MSVMKAKEIMEVIPHRQPMLLIDTIEELTPGEHGIGKKCVSYNEPYFAGHFPQEPVMPGVLMIEALAQVGAVVMLSCPEYKGKTAYFGAINQAKFKRKVVPGDVLMLEVEMIKKKGPIGIGKAVATVENIDRQPGGNCTSDHTCMQRTWHSYRCHLFTGGCGSTARSAGRRSHLYRTICRSGELS